MILADLAAHFFWRHEVDFGEHDEPDTVLNSIAQLVRQAFSLAEEKKRHIPGLGMSLPGVVDVSSIVVVTVAGKHM